MYNQLFQKITSTDTIVTPNRRLAAFLRQQFDLYLMAQNQPVWQTPDIIPLTTWLERCWEQCPSAMLLTNFQEQYLWEQIIQHSEPGSHLLRPVATAKIALQAWQLSRQWELNPTMPIFQQNENTQAWQQWAQEFKQQCQNNNWLDTQSLPAWLTQKFYQNDLPAPKRLITVGFDELNPQYQRLVATLREKGTLIEEFNYRFASPNIKRLKLADGEKELRTMAHWAHQQTLHGQGDIGCVIPNLSDIRANVFATFSDICSPQSILPGYQDSALPFNLSAGEKLKDFSLIHTALALLSLKQDVKLIDLGLLLRSPYLGFAEQEMTSRASFDAKLRSYGEPSLSVDVILLAAKKHPVPHFANHLEAYRRLSGGTEKLPANAWASLFSQQLSTWGWPGQRGLNSTEHQLLESWSKLLTQFAKLSLVSSPLSHADALCQIRNLADSQEFQPKTNSAPIQILGALEAGGLNFQQLWIMGLHDQSWPPAANPNPFLPLQLQREMDLPHSSANRELNYCRAITQRLCHSANKIILSYPERLEDRPARASPLIQHVEPITTEELLLPSLSHYAEIILASAQLETILDEQASPIYPTETIKGGSAILKYQAACPFRAFASFRLGAQELGSPEPGLSPQERGSILHSALEALWNQLQTQQKLLTTANEELTVIINSAIDYALINFIKKRPLTFRQRFTQLEKKRLYHLLKDWLEIEKNRAPFTVLTVEQSRTCEIAGIPLKLKTDRVDELANGDQLIVDYKTSLSLSANNWLGERLEEPQLPLYCITNTTPIRGILFAQIRSNLKKYIAITADDQAKIPKALTKVRLDPEQTEIGWQELVNYWRIVLNNLGQQFSQGFAKVDPKDGGKTCLNCQLHSLCRINENLRKSNDN